MPITDYLCLFNSEKENSNVKKEFGTFRVNGLSVATGVFVQAGDTLSINSSGEVNFGGTFNWQGSNDANGVSWSLPNGSTVPSLKYKSLIWTSGRTWHQGGTNTGPMTIDESGEVLLGCNEHAIEDNSGGWDVTIDRETGIDTGLPRPSSSSALIQSLSGDFELAVTRNQNQHYPGAYSGDVCCLRRSNSAPDFGAWYWRDRNITEGDGPSQSTLPIPLNRAFRSPCWLQATDGQFWGVCVQGRQVKYFALAHDYSRVRAVLDVQGANNCVGSPAITQSGFDTIGNFELIVPVEGGGGEGGGMDHYWLSRDIPHNEFNIPWNRFTHFGRPGIHVLAARLMFSTFGNLEVLALEQAPSGLELVAYWQNGPGGNWQPPVVLPGSTGRVSGSPAFIQSSFGAETGGPGNFEVIVPATNGGLLHFTRILTGSGFVWQENPSISDTRSFAAAHMIQSTFRGDGIHGNFEVIAETGNNSTFGFGQLFFCWRNSATGGWSALSGIPV